MKSYKEILNESKIDSVSSIKRVLDSIKFEYKSVEKESRDEFRVITGTATFGKKWDTLESKVYDALEKAGWDNDKISIFFQSE